MELLVNIILKNIITTDMMIENFLSPLIKIILGVIAIILLKDFTSGIITVINILRSN